jgi:glycosyltransferase involved in cell wall biosynthesis
MKILSLVPYTVFPAINGGQRNIVLFNKWIARHTSLLCVTVKSNDPGYADYPVLNRLSNSPLRYINPFYFFTLRNIIRREQVTHLVLEHPYYGWLGILLKKATGVKLVTHSSNIEATRWKSLGKWWWRILHYYERMTHRHSDYNLFIQEADRQYAITHYGLQPTRCAIATYGIEWDTPPPEAACRELQQQVKQQHGIAAEEHVLLFNGAFNYKPNLDALKIIIDSIDPLLQQESGFRYKILVCGMNIPEAISSLTYKNIIIVGFAEDISRYFKAADVFLNPIVDGGGIKTKLVEALGYNRNAVSTVSGAVGIAPERCNGKLLLSADNDWKSFARNIIAAAAWHADMGAAFYDYFAWNHIAQNTIRFIAG